MHVRSFDNVGTHKNFFNLFKKLPRVTYRPAAPIRNIDEKYLENPVFEQEWENVIKQSKKPIDELMKGAVSVLENYAKSRNVFIDLSRRMFAVKGRVPKLKDTMDIAVYNPKTNNYRFGYIPIDLDKTYLHEVKRYRIFNIVEDGTQISRKVGSEYHDTFLRHLYRSVERLINDSFK